MVNQDKVNSIVNMVRNLITAREMTEVLTNETINALIDEVVNLGIPCTDEDQIDWRTFLKHKRWHGRMKSWNLVLTKELTEEAIKIK